MQVVDMTEIHDVVGQQLGTCLVVHVQVKRRVNRVLTQNIAIEDLLDVGTRRITRPDPHEAITFDDREGVDQRSVPDATVTMRIERAVTGRIELQAVVMTNNVVALARPV